MVILNEKYSFVPQCMSMILFLMKGFVALKVERIALVMAVIVFKVPQEFSTE